MNPEARKQVEVVLHRVDETLQTAQQGLDDLLGKDKARQYTGLRNLIVFGRAVTFVLQNLRGVPDIDFDAWYEPQRVEMSADPLMRHFVRARNELEKQGKLSVGHSLHIRSFSVADMSRFGQPPVGAVSFFIGDSIGGTGWVVRTAEGASENYYVELPADIGVVRRHFVDLLPKDAHDLRGMTIEELSVEYVAQLRALVGRARAHFLG